MKVRLRAGSTQVTLKRGNPDGASAAADDDG